MSSITRQDVGKTDGHLKDLQFLLQVIARLGVGFIHDRLGQLLAGSQIQSQQSQAPVEKVRASRDGVNRFITNQDIGRQQHQLDTHQYDYNIFSVNKNTSDANRK